MTIATIFAPYHNPKYAQPKRERERDNYINKRDSVALEKEEVLVSPVSSINTNSILNLDLP